MFASNAHRSRIRAVAALATVAAAALVPATASAATQPTFCVNALECPTDGIKKSLDAALGEAAAGQGPARILVGRPPDGSAYVGPFTYSGGTAADNTIKLIGQGRPLFKSSDGNRAVVELHGQSTLQGIDIAVPRLDGADGVLLDGAGTTDVRISGGGATGLNRGAVLTNGGELSHTQIDMQSGFGVQVINSSAFIASSTIDAPFGVIGSASDLRLQQSRVHVEHKALQFIGSHGGSAPLINDGVTLIDSELTTTAGDADAVFVRDAPALLIRTTVASRTASPAAGTSALRFEALNRDIDLRVETSVLAGFERGLTRTAPAHKAPLAVRQSEWATGHDSTGGAAAGSDTRDGFVDAEPRFVDRLDGDLRLRGGDRAIDIRPNPDVFNDTDLTGHGSVDGNGDGVRQSDAGSFEYLRQAPTITALEPIPAGTAGTAQPFAAQAEDIDGDAVTLSWEFGDGQTAEGASVTHAYDRPGVYPGVLTARDEAGVTSTKPFTVNVAAGPVDAAPGPAGAGTAQADTAAPRIGSARLSIRSSALRRGSRPRLSIDVSEAATLRIALVKTARGGRRGSVASRAVKQGRTVRTVPITRRHLKALAKRREALSIVAVDAAGNKSKPKRVRLAVRG